MHFNLMAYSLKKNHTWMFCIGVVALSGCAGKIDYIKPTAQATKGSNEIVISMPKDLAWNAAIANLGKNFYVINNLDKSSGLVNLSFSADPEKYIDCGRISSYVKNARGERTYEFAGAAPHQSFEYMTAEGKLYRVEWKIELRGRVNLIFEELPNDKTRITANAKYEVKRSQMMTRVGNNISRSRSDTISFNSGQGASFSASDDGRASECVPNGQLEQDVLTIVKS